MDLWLWSLYFLPVSGALKILPEVKLDGELGGSVTIQCPLRETQVRMYLCRQMAESGICATVVSNKYVKKEYKNRISLKLSSDKNVFFVVMKQLTESDGGVYACGVGMHTDRGKTQKVTLNIHSEYEPFWEEELISEPPKWFPKFLHPQIPNWFPMVTHASSSESVPKVTTPAQRTEAPPGYHPSPTTGTTHRPRVSKTSSVAVAKPPTLLPPSAASKTSAQEGLLEPQDASYNHHTWLHRQRAFEDDLPSGREDQGFHILIPTALGLLLLALLGLVVKRAIQRRKAFSRRVRRLAMRMRALEASQRPRVSQRPRSQNNIYSACPWRARGPEAAGPRPAPLADPGASAPPAPPQVTEDPWFHAPSLKTSCEYMSICHQPAAKVENTDSDDYDDYINIPSLTHLPGCPSGPRAGCQ